ncbi:unnamed protein product [Urochloa humidicola]
MELTSMAAEGGEEGDENGLTNSSDSPSDTMKEVIECQPIYRYPWSQERGALLQERGALPQGREHIANKNDQHGHY